MKEVGRKANTSAIWLTGWFRAYAPLST